MISSNQEARLEHNADGIAPEQAMNPHNMNYTYDEKLHLTKAEND